MTDTRRHLNLNQDERTQLAEQQQIEQAVALFLDLRQDRTWQQIADELGISLSALKRLTTGAEFIRIYDEARAQVGHDPRLQAVRSSLADLLPKARRRLENLLGDTADARVSMRAIEKLFEWTGADKGIADDEPGAMNNFLSRMGIQVNGDVNLQVLPVNVPPEFQQAFQQYLHPEGTDTGVVEGRIVDSAALPTSEAHAVSSPEPAPPAQESPASSVQGGQEPSALDEPAP